MVNWREKFTATAIHFSLTLFVALLAAALIFLVWYPEPYRSMIGGTGLFLLVVSCDLVLGPLMSLVIYNSQKARFKLIFDYAVIGLLQAGSLVYGVKVVADVRPVYLAFSADRFEVVSAADIRDSELAAASDPQYRTRPWFGTRRVGVHVPPEEHNDALFQALEGNDSHQRPRFYVPLESQKDLINSRARSLAELEKAKPRSKPLLAQALADVHAPMSRLAWVPIHHGKAFWTAIIDRDTGLPVAYIDIDPY